MLILGTRFISRNHQGRQII